MSDTPRTDKYHTHAQQISLLQHASNLEMEVDMLNEELEGLKKKDPVARAEKLLTGLGVLTTTKREALVEEANQEIDEAVEICEKEKYAEPEEAYIDVYSPQFPVRRDDL